MFIRGVRGIGGKNCPGFGKKPGFGGLWKEPINQFLLLILPIFTKHFSKFSLKIRLERF